MQEHLQNKTTQLTFSTGTESELTMVDLKSLQLELAFARRARRDAEMAGLDLERVIERMQAGRSLQQIELELSALGEPAATDRTAPVFDAATFRQAA